MYDPHTDPRQGGGMAGMLAGCWFLIAEDEMLILMNIEMALEDLGCVMF